MRTDSTDSDLKLSIEEFPKFFKEVHGTKPFPWQCKLLRRVVDHGWPALIDVPTGLGKTAVLDVAVFASALRSEHARRRIFLVVDRRLIVDQANERAERIARALSRALSDSAAGEVCHVVARKLGNCGDDGSALDVTRMRGGVTWSWLWLERPDRHAIVTGTVDQIGSRLLFRGYGVGDGLRPIDAALTGTDSLIIIDEAHLSDVFLTTLRDIRAIAATTIGCAPIIVAMSASPGQSALDAHEITTEDEQHPVAGPRLHADKKLCLAQVSASKDAAPDKVTDALAYWAQQLGGPGRVIGVVANTVARARKVFEKLREGSADSSECTLLTGRIRPVDREYLLNKWYPRIQVGATRDTEQSYYVIATQTIEVGADIDLDGLITESASLPALIQRLGRVNRIGERAGATAVVVHCDGLADGIYGSARQHTWEWLADLAKPISHRAGRTLADLGAGIDASPMALRSNVRNIAADALEEMRGTQPYAPLVTTATLDTWVRTSPLPHPDIPVEPYLHGIGAGEPDVAVVWRADATSNDPQQWRRSVERVPPQTEEALELPISAVRRWLAQSPGQDRPDAARIAQSGQMLSAESQVSDTEPQVTPELDEDRPARDSKRPRALRYQGPDSSEPVTPSEIRPGDLLIVPARWGGCDQYGWNPNSAESAVDVADLCGGTHRRAVAVRIGATFAKAIRTVAPDLSDQVDELVARIKDDLGDDSPDVDTYRALLKQMLPVEGARGLPHERVLHRLAKGRRLTLVAEEGGDDGVAAILTVTGSAWNDDSDAVGTSACAKPLSLRAHQAAVRNRAGEFARNLGLAEPVIEAVRLAAEHHDEGKRDCRFQIMLHGGDRWLAQAATEPLAKSGMDPADRAGLRLAWLRSRYPHGMRHEALSARIAQVLLSDRQSADLDLVIHLITSHHGFGRPLLPPVDDRAPVTIQVADIEGKFLDFDSAETIDWDGPIRFTRLCRRYGYWGLALLESIVRLADIWASARWEEST
jgi:CRISPR-associated endonuclease/helicase Cas3